MSDRFHKAEPTGRYFQEYVQRAAVASESDVLFNVEVAPPPEAVALTVHTFDGDEPAIPVAASWILRNRGQQDHACEQCVPHSDCLIQGFRCYYHEAEALLSPRVPPGCSTYTRGGRDDHCLRCGEPASSHEPQLGPLEK